MKEKEGTVPVDYTPQLTAIATALQKPTPWWASPWILATFSTVLGLLGGFVGQAAVTRVTEARKFKRMRRMAYEDVTELFVALDTTLIGTAGNETDAGRRLRQDNVLAATSVLAPEYIRANQDIYTNLPERQSFTVIYSLYNRLLNSPPQDFDARLREVMQMIAVQFKAGRFSVDYIRKNMGQDASETFNKALNGYMDRTWKKGKQST